MKSECGNKDFGTAVQFLAVDPVTAECMMINTACKGAGTDELLLGTLICGRTNEEMDILKVRSRFDISLFCCSFKLFQYCLQVFSLFPLCEYRKNILPCTTTIWVVS